MSVEENKAIVKKFWEEIAKGNADAFSETLSSNLAHHWSDGKPKVKNFEEMKEMLSGKPIHTTDDMMAEGDRVAEWITTASGSHTCWIYRLSGGKIVESWNMVSIQRNGEPGGF